MGDESESEDEGEGETTHASRVGRGGGANPCSYCALLKFWRPTIPRRRTMLEPQRLFSTSSFCENALSSHTYYMARVVV